MIIGGIKIDNEVCVHNFTKAFAHPHDSIHGKPNIYSHWAWEKINTKHWCTVRVLSKGVLRYRGTSSTQYYGIRIVAIPIETDEPRDLQVLRNAKKINTSLDADSCCAVVICRQTQFDNWWPSTVKHFYNFLSWDMFYVLWLDLGRALFIVKDEILPRSLYGCCPFEKRHKFVFQLSLGKGLAATQGLLSRAAIGYTKPGSGTGTITRNFQMESTSSHPRESRNEHKSKMPRKVMKCWCKLADCEIKISYMGIHWWS